MERNNEGWYEFILSKHDVSYCDLENWCKNNLLNEYKIIHLLTGPGEVAVHPVEYSIRIHTKKDATAFKLKWI